MILGVVPCGGKAVRWNGYPKDMLPVENGLTLIDHTIKAMRTGGAEEITVITSKEKIVYQVQRLGYEVDYRISESGVWDAIKTSFSYQADWNLFAMPDTYYPQDVFSHQEMFSKDFNIGVFYTLHPERFGVLLDGQIHDKEQLPPDEYLAWGVLNWSENVVDFWRTKTDKIKTHTDAFNAAMAKFGYSRFIMDYYYDMASWQDYRNFMMEHTEW